MSKQSHFVHQTEMQFKFLSRKTSLWLLRKILCTAITLFSWYCSNHQNHIIFQVVFCALKSCRKIISPAYKIYINFNLPCHHRDCMWARPACGFSSGAAHSAAACPAAPLPAIADDIQDPRWACWRARSPPTPPPPRFCRTLAVPSPSLTNRPM